MATAETTISKDQLSQLLKNYAAVATAADMLLKTIRAQKSITKSVAVAANGMAQILGQDAVVVSKAVPTQPYEYSEPDVDKRGPADEDLGANFTPRSMPGSMVGRVQFAVKGVEASKAFPAVAPDEEEKKPAMPWDEAKMSKAVEDAVTKALAAQKTEKIEKVAEKVVEKPESKQVMTDEQRQVRKSQGYRFGESYSDVVFGNGARG